MLNYDLSTQYSPSNSLKQCIFRVSVPASFSCVASKKVFELTSGTGSLASFNYPLPYDLYHVDCLWTITVNKYKRIELSFDVFNLSGSAPKCLDSDYVEFGNGDPTFAKDTQRLCGSEKPATMKSKDSVMWFRFVSTGKTKYPGFKASYKSVGWYEWCWLFARTPLILITMYNL